MQSQVYIKNIHLFYTNQASHLKSQPIYVHKKVFIQSTEVNCIQNIYFFTNKTSVAYKVSTFHIYSFRIMTFLKENYAHNNYIHAKQFVIHSIKRSQQQLNYDTNCLSALVKSNTVCACTPPPHNNRGRNTHDSIVENKN